MDTSCNSVNDNPSILSLEEPTLVLVADLDDFQPAEYEVDIRSGFLPALAPLDRLVDAPWNLWEEAFEATDGFRAGIGEDSRKDVKQWRTYIRDELPVLEVGPLESEVRELRRAHLILAFLTHTYVHLENTLDNKPPILIPPSLAIPFCAVSDLLRIPSILTYSDTVLYNWYLKDPEEPFTTSNLEIITTFTRTNSEAHFYKTSVLVEVVGTSCLSLMRSSLDEAFLADAISIQRISSHLACLARAIDEITKVLEAVRDECDPRTFYWEIRPWLNGGRWIMEGVPSDTESGWRALELAGPSAGQSTLIHAIDIFLGVDHGPADSKTTEETFMKRMSDYMPKSHRSFLLELANSIKRGETIRSLAMSNRFDEDLKIKENYNEAIRALERLRNAHSRVALLYIVCQSRVEPPPGSAFYQQWYDRVERPAISITTVHGELPAHEKFPGTGGTDLAKFLKRCKAKTVEALI